MRNLVLRVKLESQMLQTATRNYMQNHREEEFASLNQSQHLGQLLDDRHPMIEPQTLIASGRALKAGLKQC